MKNKQKGNFQTVIHYLMYFFGRIYIHLLIAIDSILRIFSKKPNVSLMIKREEGHYLEFPANIPPEEIKKLIEQLKELDTPLIKRENSSQLPQNLKLSLLHPKKLSKRFSSRFIVNIYSEKDRADVTKKFEQELDKKSKIYTESTYDSRLTLNITVIVELSSPDINFSDKKIKILKDGINSIYFWAKPKDTCYPGNHTILLSITNKETNEEYESFPCTVKVVDFAFDHVSRPFLSNLMSAVLGLGSVVTFSLTLLGKIDNTLGLASGTAAGILAAFIRIQFLQFYQWFSEVKKLKP